MDRLDTYVALLEEANTRQNLVSRATLPDVWQRHVMDAVQLAALGPAEGQWVDVGSGAGLPGLVLAILLPARFTLIEPRTKRATFLADCIATLDLADRVVVEQSRAETVAPFTAAAITARAVAPLDQLFGIAAHLSGPNTTWILPKGRTAADEVASARALWQGEMDLVPSRTDPSAFIVVARRIRQRNRR